MTSCWLTFLPVALSVVMRRSMGERGVRRCERSQDCVVLGGQDGRVVKASFFCEIAMVTRGFETRLQILPSKVLWYVALVSLTSAILYGAGICRYF